ncbi:MAG: pYEATS domain-containing protein [Desulfovibrio sp.]
MMVDPLKTFSSTAQGLARNPLGIIALFIVLVYGFACLVVSSTSPLESSDRRPIVWFIVIFPVIVIGVFGWLVSRHHKKLYAPSDFKDESNFLANIRVELDNLPSASPSSARRCNTQPTEEANDWTSKRGNIYKINRGYFLAHVLEPSQQAGQLYDIFIYIIKHKSKDCSDVKNAEFFFGSFWDNKVFTASRSGDFIGVKTSAYGPFLALCRITFTDNTAVVLDKYIDFEMGFAVKRLLAAN